MNIFKKLVFIIKRPRVVLITGKGRFRAIYAIRFLLNFYSGKKDVLVFESDLSKPGDIDKFSFYLKKSKLPILIITNTGKISLDRLSFQGNEKEVMKIKELAKILPANGFLILNFDDEAVQSVAKETKAHILTYGFQEKASIKVSDVNVDKEKTNFKISIEGNIVPFWIKNLFGKEYIYSIMAAISLGKIKNMNLVSISQNFQNYRFSENE